MAYSIATSPQRFLPSWNEIAQTAELMLAIGVLLGVFTLIYRFIKRTPLYNSIFPTPEEI